MRFFLKNWIFVFACNFMIDNVLADPVLQSDVKLNGIICTRLKEGTGSWGKEIADLLSNEKIQEKTYLKRVKNELDKISDSSDSQSLYNASSAIRMSICDFPVKDQPVLRKIVNNLMLRAAIEGTKDAIYDIMDTYPSQQDLDYILVDKKMVLSTESFTAIRESLEESDVDDIDSTERLKVIVGNALLKASSAPNSLVVSPRDDVTRTIHSDPE